MSSEYKVPVSLSSSKEGKTVHLTVSDTTTVKEARTMLHRFTKKSIDRIALSFVVNGEVKARMDRDDATLASYGVTEAAVAAAAGGKLQMKDLGPQISYRTVFIIEYLGPIIIMALYAMRPTILYGPEAALAEWNWVAKLGVAAWVAHFVKRELETVFVHKFSRSTMPLSNLFKNSAYYWGFAAVVGYVLCHPDYTAPTNMTQIQVGGGLMAAAELVNLLVHLQLSGMRKVEGDKKRDAPGGPLFALVSCPNYTAEVLSWVGFSIMVQIAASYAFTTVGLLQMSQWALKKHADYIKSSDGAYKKKGRKAIIPFLL